MNNLCAGCGACCRDHIPLTDQDRQHIDSAMLYENGGMWLMRRGVDNIHCTALDLKTRKCLIYENRPEICRNFEVDGPGCKTLRDQAAAAGFISLIVL